MKRGSTLFLKIAVIVIGIPVLALCIFLLPKIGYEAIEQVQKGSELAYIVIGILFVMYAATIPFYMALYQALKLLSYIDRRRAFSIDSVSALKKIRIVPSPSVVCM
ncbi:hypothetical protein GCM10009001_16320 [Virgibacillus siamensis]|uniref:DUF975 family protein n=1 Tax=Virgibacillus siamensis TaxID=480071 RepID=A0ABP3R1L6_9BACI